MDVGLMRTTATGTALPVLAEQAWAALGTQSQTLFEGRRVTSAELGALSLRVATGLRGAGLAPGDRVVVCMANCLEVGVTYHAVWRAGAVVTPVLFLLSADELRHVLVDSGATVVVTTPEFVPKVAAAAAGLDTLRAVAVAGELPADTGGLPIVAFDSLIADTPAPMPATDPTALAALLYTGGTTGRSKGVMLSHDAMSVAAWSATVSGSEADWPVSLVPLPLAHVFGLMVSTMSLHAVTPTTMVLMRWFDPAGWVALAEAERANVGPIVPTMLRLLLTQPLEQHDLSALQRLSSGSAPLPPPLLDEFARRLPHVEIGDGYGCTETAALVSSSPRGRVRHGSVGVPSAVVEVRIEALPGADDEGPLAPGTDGEICVRGPMLMTGYWHSPEETERALRDGWFHTGDVGHLDADGYLYIVDRLKDVIIRGGFNVYPRDVEDVLMAHPAVAVAAVVGRPDEQVGEEVVAYVQLAAGAEATPDELREYAREHLSAVKYPREVHVVDAVPLTSVGKLDRKRLRQ